MANSFGDWRKRPAPVMGGITDEEWQMQFTGTGGGSYNPNVPGQLWNIGNVPYHPGSPSARGIYTSQPMPEVSTYETPMQSTYGYDPADPYNVSGYDIADTTGLQPTSDWYGSISPEVMAGLNAPYDDARQQMFEQLGAMGQLGTMDALSGAGGAALGEFEANRARDIGLSAWQMMQPGMLQQFLSQTEANKYLAEGQNIRDRDLWTEQTAADKYLAEWQNVAGQDWATREYGRLGDVAEITNQWARDYRDQATQENFMDWASTGRQMEADYGSAQWLRDEQTMMNKWPYLSAADMIGGTYPDTVVNPGGNDSQIPWWAFIL